jgi:hypothetical protein
VIWLGLSRCAPGGQLRLGGGIPHRPGREATDGLQLLMDPERAWFAARRAVAGRRRHSRAAMAVDILAAAPQVCASSLAAGLGMAVNNAAVLLEGLCAAGFAVELTHRAKRRLFGLAALTPVREVAPPRRPAAIPLADPVTERARCPSEPSRLWNDGTSITARSSTGWSAGADDPARDSDAGRPPGGPAGATGRRRAPYSRSPIGDSGSPARGRLVGLPRRGFRQLPHHRSKKVFFGSRLNRVKKVKRSPGLDGTLEKVPRHMYVKRWEEMGRGRKADAQFDWQPTHQQRKSRTLLGAHSILYYAIRVEQMLAQFDRYQFTKRGADQSRVAAVPEVLPGQ